MKSVAQRQFHIIMHSYLSLQVLNLWHAVKTPTMSMNIFYIVSPIATMLKILHKMKLYDL